MNSILQKYKHFATWTKNIYILLIFHGLYIEFYCILQSGKHILAAYNKQKIVQSKVRRFIVVFRRRPSTSQKVTFCLQKCAKSCIFTLKYLAKRCKITLKNPAESCKFTISKVVKSYKKILYV